MSYRHLTKAGARFTEQLTKRPAHLQQHFDKFEKKAMPAFLTPSIPRVEQADRFTTPEQWKFMPGDRVVITKGKFKGKTSYITQHDTETNGFVLDENGPTQTVPVPKMFWTEGQKSHVVTFPVAVKQEDLRLLAEIDEEGATKLVAVADVVFRGAKYNPEYKKVMPIRVVSGQEDLVIPWPKPKEVEDGALATEAQAVREQTFWTESFVTSPIPQGALKTIRKQHSKWRRGEMTARDVAKFTAPKMPLSESKKAYYQEKKENKGNKLSAEEIEQIGSKVKKFLEE